MTRRFGRRSLRSIVISAALVGAVLLRLGYDLIYPSQSADTVALLQEGPCEVVRAVDECTMVVRQPAHNDGRGTPISAKDITVRLLGIDAATNERAEGDLQRMATGAVTSVQQLVGREDVRLRLDKRRMDRRGHALAYVYVGDQLLSEQLVREGLVRALAYPGDSLSIGRRLREAQQQAYDAKRGIWSGH